MWGARAGLRRTPRACPHDTRRQHESHLTSAPGPTPPGSSRGRPVSLGDSSHAGLIFPTWPIKGVGNSKGAGAASRGTERAAGPRLAPQTLGRGSVRSCQEPRVPGACDRPSLCSRRDSNLRHRRLGSRAAPAPACLCSLQVESHTHMACWVEAGIRVPSPPPHRGTPRLRNGLCCPLVAARRSTRGAHTLLPAAGTQGAFPASWQRRPC